MVHCSHSSVHPASDILVSPWMLSPGPRSTGGHRERRMRACFREGQSAQGGTRYSCKQPKDHTENPCGLVAQTVSEAEYTCHWLALGDQGRLLGRGRREGQIIGATYILLDELRVNQAGSRDQLIGIKVNQVVAGLCREKGEEAGHRWRDKATAQGCHWGHLSFSHPTGTVPEISALEFYILGRW